MFPLCVFYMMISLHHFSNLLGLPTLLTPCIHCLCLLFLTFWLNMFITTTSNIFCNPLLFITYNLLPHSPPPMVILPNAVYICKPTVVPITWLPMTPLLTKFSHIKPYLMGGISDNALAIFRIRKASYLGKLSMRIFFIFHVSTVLKHVKPSFLPWILSFLILTSILHGNNMQIVLPVKDI